MSIKERKMKFGRAGYQNDPQAKQRRQFKAARIIVRNLPFSSTEENLKEHFSEFGEVAEVKLLRKDNNKLVGCGFIQFDNKLSAANAIQKASGKQFKGRVIIADWAVPKDQFIKSQQVGIKSEVKEEPVEIKQEDSSEDDVSIKEEPESENESDSGNKGWSDIKSESDEDEEESDKEQSDSDEEQSDSDEEQSDSDEEQSDSDEEQSDSDEEQSDSDEEQSDSDEEQSDSDGEETKPRKRVRSESDSEDETNTDSDDDSQDEDDSEEDFDEGDSDEDVKPNVNKLKKRWSNDVTEGKTVFIKNVPFMATEEELEKAVERFGPIYYAKICMDPMTEHSKGTAFVKFKSVESAESCLQAGTEFTLNGTVLDPQPALARKDIISKKNQPKQPSDSRNLYLLKEGVVMAGSKAAEGVSAADMAKRLDIERWKRQIIKDLGKFVSRYRLVIHNIPLYYDDKKTAQLIKKYCPSTARFKEVRVMRDLKKLESNGMGKSKGFAFVSFDKHEDALATLRALNNNPTVFKPQKRPIVSFSVESRKALKIKEGRLEKSRQVKAGLDSQPSVKIEKDTIKLGRNKFKDKKHTKSKDIDNEVKNKKDETKKEEMEVDEEESEKPKYAGSFATPGSRKFMNNLSVKKQALLHRKELKREKTKNKLSRKKMPRKIRKQMKMENMTRQRKFDKEDKEFTSLVDKYRSQIMKGEKKKWFE